MIDIAKKKLEKSMEGSNRFLNLHRIKKVTFFIIVLLSTTIYHKFYFTFRFTDQDWNEFFMSLVLCRHPTKVYCISIRILKRCGFQIQKYFLCVVHTFC